MQSRSMKIPVIIETRQTAGKKIPALVDSGAQGKFINRRIVRRHALQEKPLARPIKVYNVDGTPNELGYIRNYVELKLRIAGKVTTEKLLVTQLGKQDMILGLDWLQEQNPSINWKKGTLEFNTRIRTIEIEDIPDEPTGRTLNALPQGDGALLRHEDDFLIEQTDPELTPIRGTNEAAGIDLRSAQDVTLPPNSRILVNTGVKCRTPQGTYARLAPRSGLALKGIDVAAGVIDRDFTGEIRALLVNTTASPYPIKKGDKIAQLILEKIDTVTPIPVNKLPTTQRGNKGFG